MRTGECPRGRLFKDAIRFINVQQGCTELVTSDWRRQDMGGQNSWQELWSLQDQAGAATMFDGKRISTNLCDCLCCVRQPVCIAQSSFTAPCVPLTRRLPRSPLHNTNAGEL